MSVNEKAIEIRNLVALVCEVIPAIVSIVKEIIIAIKDIKAV